MSYINTTAKIMTLVGVGLIVAACDNGGNSNNAAQQPPAEPPPPVTLEFQVEIVNLTAAQPFSPIAVVAHNPDYTAFSIGTSATAGLELLAEGGDNGDFLSEADASDSVVATLSGTDPLPPGATETLTLTIEEDNAADLQFSMVTMLVNTNDGITGARNVDVSQLAVDESLQLHLISYDSGTEANTESAGSIPGPADGGEGFNATRDDIADEVRGHGGVLTTELLPESVLTELNRWDNPVARAMITRVE